MGDMINYDGVRERAALLAQQQLFNQPGVVLAYGMQAQMNPQASDQLSHHRGYLESWPRGGGLGAEPICPKNKTGDEVANAAAPKVESKKEEKKMFSLYGSARDYVKRHGDIIFTVFFIMMADKWFFNGQLKGALQRLVEKMISKADLHLDKPVVDVK